MQGKHTTPNHKVKKMYVKDESEWVRIEKITRQSFQNVILS